jgi:hypothetical protein
MICRQIRPVRAAGLVLFALSALPVTTGRAYAQAAAAAAATAAAAGATSGHGNPRIDLGPPADASDFTEPLSHELNAAYDEYLGFKTRLQNDYNLQFAMPVTVYGQWARPNGGPGNAQLVYTPQITWTPFTDTAIGSGAVNVLFQSYQFWTRPNTGARLGSMGLITEPNAWGANGYQLAQLTYTHTFPGQWLAVAVGQYSFGQYDDNQYSGDAQTTFINYALAQSGTQTYANAGTGAYVQINPNSSLQFAGGVQSATDISGHAVTTNGWRDNKLAYFVSAQWTTEFMAGGTYNIIYYNQPSVPQQPSASQGVSFSASQDINETYGLFVRVNNASGTVVPIETSIAFGGIVNNPFDRLRLDQAGVGIVWDKTNKAAVRGPSRNAEWVTELYYNYWLFKGMFLTPDLQVYFNPALAPNTSVAAAFTLRTTFQF